MFKTTKKIHLIAFRADDKLATVLEKLAEKNGVTVSTYIRMLLTSMLIDEEEWDEYE